MNTSRMTRWLIATLMLILPIGAATSCSGQGERVARQSSAANACAPAPVLTFERKLGSKLYIAGTGWANCIQSAAILGAVLANQAASFAFCMATGVQFNENPPSDANPVPLDARVLSVGKAEWQCQAGNAAPFNGSFVSGGSAGGPEGPVVGIANNPGIRDNINANGTYGFVSSGHPNPLVEPSFQAITPRWTTDIWNKVTATITCATDNRGQPTSSTAFNATYTRFPSHKIWTHTPLNAPPVLLFSKAQGLFSNLWWLPAVPAP